MKTHLTILMLLLASWQTMAQCRLVRLESPDTAIITYYNYDKLGRLASVKSDLLFQGKPMKFEFYYFYNNDDKIVAFNLMVNDTLEIITHFIYENGLITKQYQINLLDSILFTSQLFYNDNKQLVRYLDKSSKGDSIEMQFEYTPFGVPKKRTRITNKPEGFNVIDYAWDTNQKTILPERMISVGYPTYLTWAYVTPLAPLSVKGDLKGSILYKKDKEGKLYKADEDVFSDIKANTSGYYQEGKYKGYQSNKTFRIWAVYEGCKN